MKKTMKCMVVAFVMLIVAMGVQAQNSVLSSGDWYKIAVEQTGIHQITYDDLVSYGIDPGQINPKQIRLYGNGNGMLPEANDAFRYDDLQENAIFVSGEDDGVFDPGDYVLFYGEGPTDWKLNEETGLFEHRVNLYSDFTFYFLNFDLGDGKRIEKQNLSTAAPTYTSFALQDYYYHELELENLIHSGKQWVGDRFDNVLEYSFEIDFPNLITTAPVNFATSVLARSSLASHFSFTINASEVLSLTCASVSGVIYSDYAKNRTGSVNFFADTGFLNLSISYEKPNDTAVGWLDYLVFNASRLNIFENGQMLFRDVGSIGEGKVTQFQVTTNNSNIDIWNITNPINPSLIEYEYSGGKAKFTLETDSLL
ncbi:MAG: hypothetical protein GXO89_05950, partial [Chlorobi bacterium]|nr:hypothetical protein [Chlorobiota bacterium]